MLYNPIDFFIKWFLKIEYSQSKIKKLSDFQSAYFITTTYPAIWLFSRSVNLTKLIVLPQFLIYLILVPSAFTN